MNDSEKFRREMARFKRQFAKFRQQFEELHAEFEETLEKWRTGREETVNQENCASLNEHIRFEFGTPQS